MELVFVIEESIGNLCFHTNLKVVLMAKNLGIGIVGLGNQGKLHLGNCLNCRGVTVQGVADTSKSSLKYAHEAGIKNTYSNYEDLLKDRDVEAVIIGLPNFLHAESAIKAAEAGKHILLEKPIARNLAEGQKIVDAARKNGVKLMMGYPLRFDPEMKNLREQIRDGLFGEVEIAEAANISSGPFTPQGNSAGPTPVPDWWFNKELVGGGALIDLGIHVINLLAWYFGDVESVSSFLGYKFKMDVEDLAVCCIHFKNGPLAMIKAGWFSKRQVGEVHIYGTSNAASIVTFPKGRLNMITGDLKKNLGIHTQNPGLGELNSFVDCVVSDTTPSPSGEDGLLDIKIITLAYQNSKLLY